jgi:hypothetical protein
MKFIKIVVILTILAQGIGKAQNDFRVLPNSAYFPGEKLSYLIHYGPLNGGIVNLDLVDTEMYGRHVFHAKGVGRTTGLTDKIFRVNDIYESFFEKETNLPVKAVRNIREGNYKTYNEVLFDHSNNSLNSKKSGYHKVPANILDMVSSFYYLRRINFENLKPGTSIKLLTYFSDELFPYEVRYKGTETIKIKSGTFKCYKFVPIVEPGRIFKENDDMTIWLSQDKNLIPISVAFEMWVGTFRVDLLEYSNLRNPLMSKIK